MTEPTRTILEQGGVNVADALERFMNSEALLERFLKRFPQDKNPQALQTALDGGDVEGAIQAVHALKGVSGNLSLTVLFERTSAQLAMLRAGDLAGARAALPDVLQACAAATQAIRAAYGVE